MAKPTVSLPQGTRDFGPDVLRKRKYIMRHIQNAFEQFGFQPLETPAMENLDTLMGKYGEEGDKLIFKILNNGLDQPEKREKARADFERVLEGKNVKEISERALRYDLTIPFARYVAMNQGQLSFPFRRYQIQPVWRADRPQKGRYREFYQCDADIVGSTSLLNEVELAGLYQTVFQQLGIAVDIRINSRRLLSALAEECGGADKLIDITVAIDKLDKIGPDRVKEELADRGLSSVQVETISRYLALEGSAAEKIAAARQLLGKQAAAEQGLKELDYLLSFFPAGDNCPLQIDFTLARGLNYYTGLIFEVKARDFSIGSIGGGGRYDDLTGLFGVPGIPGVGISFGLDRIYDVMEGLNLFPDSVQAGTRVLFFNLGEEEGRLAYAQLQAVRQRDIAAEIYPEQAKFDKQFKYAQKKNIPYVVIIGSQERQDHTCVIKELASGRQETLPLEALAGYSFAD